MMMAGYTSSVLLCGLEILFADVECEHGHSRGQCSNAGGFGVRLFDDGGFAVDGAEILPSWVLFQYLALLGVVGSGSELLRYLAEVVELRVLSFRRGDL